MQSAKSPIRALLRFGGFVLSWLVCVLGTAWAALALFFDVRRPALAKVMAASLICWILALLFVKGAGRKTFAIWAGTIAAVILWWFMLSATNDRPWQPDVARLPWAEVAGDQVTIHNIRNCDYVTETDYAPHWESKTFQVSHIRGVDLFLVHWGSPWIAHAILSFEFTDGEYLAMSIEARKTVGQNYSALRGFFRQYNLIYIVAEEQDVVRVRTNFRTGEDVRLYHTNTTPADSQHLFLAYMKWINRVRDKPEWYNALTSNCTSGIVSYLRQAKVGGLATWDWRTLLNGHGDEMLYELGDLTTGKLSFTELSRQALINSVAKQAGDAPDFSQLIRAGHPGFSNTGVPEPRPK